MKFLRWITDRSALSRLDTAGLILLVSWLATTDREVSAGWGLAAYFVFMVLSTILEVELHPERNKT